MTRKIRSGIDTPVHVMKKTGSSSDQAKCELDDCIENARASARGNQPGFECEHLRSVQNSLPFIPQQPLEDDVLDEMINELRWLKESRRAECYSLRDKAVCEGICSVYPWLPEEGQSTRFLHFSVYSGTTSYWCRFGRCIVSFDTVKSIWKCACSPAKRGCTHKALAKWYSLQNYPEKVKSLSTSELCSENEFEDDAEELNPQVDKPAQSRHTSFSYPPIG